MSDANRKTGPKRGGSPGSTPSSSGARQQRSDSSNPSRGKDVHHRESGEKRRNLPRVFGERRPQTPDRSLQLWEPEMHQGGQVQGQVDRSPPTAIQQIRSLAKCDKCPFYRADNFRPVVPTIPEKPYGVLIGESPGREETEQGVPFVGTTGEALNEELLQAGLLRSKLAIINAICCLPTAKNVSVMGKAVKACHPVFLHYIKQVNPKLPVFAMGAWAMAAYVGKRKAIEKARGFLRDVELSDDLKVEIEEEEESSEVEEKEWGKVLKPSKK